MRNAEIPIFHQDPHGREVLVTGANGSMGPHYVRRLAQHTPVKAMARRDSEVETLSQIPNVTGVKADVTNLDSLRRATENVGTVFHLVVNPSITDWRANFKVNVGGTENLALASEENGVGHVHLISSIAVYGKQPGNKPIKEDAPHYAQNAYGVTKSGQERVLFDSTNRFDASAIRPANVIGHDIDVWTHAILSALEGFDKNRDLGNEGLEKIASKLGRQWIRRLATLSPILTTKAVFATIEIENAIDLSIRAAQSPNGVGEAFNAVDDNIYFSELATRYLREVLNRPAINLAPIATLPLTFMLDKAMAAGNLKLSRPEVDGLRSLLFHGQKYSTEKADTLLEHKHRVSLDESVAQTAKYVRENGIIPSRKLYK